MADDKETKKQMSDDIGMVTVMLKAHNDFLKALLEVPSIPIPLEQRNKFNDYLEAIDKKISEILKQ